MTRSKIIEQIEEQKIGPIEGKESCCLICYTNEITRQGQPVTDLSTVELECSHRFCSECTVESLRVKIESAEIDKLKCFDYECGQVISISKVKTILMERNLDELFQKLERFKK